MSALFRPRRDSEPLEEGIVNNTHKSQFGVLNQPFGLVSDDECRRAVGRLNSLRLMRAESLGDGYDVSDILLGH